MSLSQSIQQKLLQKLSPQQIQLMKLLQIPTANLEERIKEELEENPALEQGEEGMEEEFGDILFAIVNFARWNKINPEVALLKANSKFIKRFEAMETLASKELTDYNFKEYDDLWKQAKELVYKNSKSNQSHKNGKEKSGKAYCSAAVC